MNVYDCTYILYNLIGQYLDSTHLILSLSCLDSVLNFIRGHPLMDEAVAHKDNEPVFYMRDLFFTRLVVDVLDYVVFGNHLHYTVYYAATSEFKFYICNIIHIVNV